MFTTKYIALITFVVTIATYALMIKAFTRGQTRRQIPPLNRFLFVMLVGLVGLIAFVAALIPVSFVFGTFLAIIDSVAPVEVAVAVASIFFVLLVAFLAAGASLLTYKAIFIEKPTANR